MNIVGNKNCNLKKYVIWICKSYKKNYLVICSDEEHEIILLLESIKN